MATSTYIIIMAVCLILSAYFSATETAFSSVNTTKLKALAEKGLEIMEDRPIQYTYPLEMPLKDKINAIAAKIYRADGVNYSAAASKTLAELTEMGYGNLPVCIAKTQYSFSDNAKLTGAPTGFTMEVREVRLAAGAGFVVVICGNIMTMPGLPKKPAAVGIDVDADGKITGLF